MEDNHDAYSKLLQGAHDMLILKALSLGPQIEEENWARLAGAVFKVMRTT
jgi:hypothetical protein